MVMTYVMSYQILLDTRNESTYSLRVGMLTVLKILGHLLFKGEGVTPYVHDLHATRCSLKWNKNMYGLEMGISTVF
jgi:hypothetical protein